MVQLARMDGSPVSFASCWWKWEGVWMHTHPLEGIVSSMCTGWSACI